MDSSTNTPTPISKAWAERTGQKRVMTWEYVCCELGENLNLSYGKVEELLSTMVFVLKHESKLSRQQVVDYICTMAANDWERMEELFVKARDGKEELKAKKNKIEMDRSMRSLHNSLRGIMRFYQTHGPRG